MSRKRKTRGSPYVDHPRYGDRPIDSGYSYSEDEIRNSYWGYRREDIFIETAIPADLEKQNFPTFPRKLYVDIRRKCIQCERWFIFFAREQKYWYEELGFIIDADCVKCVECRKKEQGIKQLISEYEKLLKISSRTESETINLKEIAQELYEFGYIKNKQKVDSIA